MRKLFVLAAAVLLFTFSASASRPYVIYPVPHSLNPTSGTASFSASVNIVAEAGIDQVTIDRAKQVLSECGLSPVVSDGTVRNISNLVLGVSGSRGIADKLCDRLHLPREVFTLPKFDRHILSLHSDKKGNAQVLILGENTDAVFCGLASLEQIFDNGTGPLGCVDIFDYADIRDRGVIEGYYGVPYSAEVTKDIFRFMARYKMNTYMYGAKSDPYHSGFWSEPYPENISDDQVKIGMLSRGMLSDIAACARDSKVNFIWAIHPGNAFCDPDSTSTLSRIMDKFDSMYELGVRQFGVFVDDVGLPSDPAVLRCGADRLTELQRMIDDRWNRPGSSPADTVKPLNYVPQLYAYEWVEAPEARKFFNSLRDVPEKVKIYITGNAIWTVPNNHDLETVKFWLGRYPSWWWNYPCNDNDETKLFTMDTYTNFKDESHIDNLSRLEPLVGAKTVIINPMQQGEVSKLTFFSVADYEWNNEAFNNETSWEAAVPAVVGSDRAEAFRKIAPYLRYYDNDALAYRVKLYKASVAEGNPHPEALVKDLMEVIDACAVIEAMGESDSVSDVLFYEDIRPWLLRLSSMAEEAVCLLSGKPYHGKDIDSDPEFKFDVLRGMGNDISLAKLKAAPASTVLRPFIEWLKER